MRKYKEYATVRRKCKGNDRRNENGFTDIPEELWTVGACAFLREYLHNEKSWQFEDFQREMDVVESEYPWQISAGLSD